ncbi:hypothetical protein QWY85_11105 [Neolewinella lacunae]|uniref:Uncharacterized protein n=1 Tax=Neolewinella lacunae TaxID=1517758 RepID=A0A923PKR4_9BACT|nr:hypothetical protein [Neolewinella lacunae]MBC6995948.1 hypothetical protein [Neolewinella lacunae]MDN3635208.1 hypothetical protein [Neolewinella lacunae]
MIPLTILSVVLLVAVMLLLRTWSANRMPGKKQRARAVRELKEEMDTWTAELVPLNKEELDLFSLAQDKQVVKTGAGASAKGTFTTIFHEPVVSYSYRRYLGKQVNELLYARTAEHDYVYWTENGKTTLEIDDQPVGSIDKGVLLGARTGKPLAQIAGQARENYLPISVGNREVGSLTAGKASKADPLGQRAFEFIPKDLNDKEEQLLMSLATLELVRRSLPA